MNLDPKEVYNLISKYAEDTSEGPDQCVRLFTKLNDIFTKKELSLSYLDLHLQQMFNKFNGLFAFIEKVLCGKNYKSSIIKILEIFYTLINSFPFKLEKHVFIIHNICLKIIKSSNASSDEKVRALDVFHISFEKIRNKSVDGPYHYKEIYVYLRDSVGLKKTDSVLGKTFIALGTFAKNFQDLVEEPETLKCSFLCKVNTYMSMFSIKPSYAVLADLFTGFSNFCESFPLDLNTEEDIVGNLYKYIEKLSVPIFETKTANRAALKFFANNILAFTHLVIEKFEDWHNTLRNWLVPNDQENFKIGVFVIRSFYQGLGCFLLKEETNTQYKNVVEYFVNHFQERLKYGSTIDKGLSLYGFFSFAEAFQNFLNEEEIYKLLTFIIPSFEKKFILNQEGYPDDALELLPYYIQAIVKFVQDNKKTNKEYICLRSGVIIMIKTFPQLPYSQHSLAVGVLVFTFQYLARKNKQLFNIFIKDIVYEGVIWTCSHRHTSISEAEILEENSNKIITVKNYINLWKGLLTSEEKTKIVEKLIETMFILIDKLNISIILADVDSPVTDIESAYKVSRVDDYAIFLNMVDFYQEIFVLIEPSMISKFICKLIHNLFSKCIKNPLISGFYKILSSCLKICNEVNFFDEANMNSSDVCSCYHLLQKFFHVLLKKTKELKGDLLIACFQVLLQYPTSIIRQMLPACVSPFRIMFQVGKNYIPLTDMALSVLEHWQRDIPNEDMEPFLVQIIPLLDSYLRSQSIGGSTQTNQLQKRRKTAQPLKKRQIVIEIQPELSKLQNKILNFIGKQSSTVCQAFVFSENNIELAVWGHQNHLKITLPYEDRKLDIYMDKCLTRIVDLALNCTEKSTRLAACELLDATVMVFLGTTRKMHASALADLNELLEYMVFPLLKLGCDMDPVVRQIFRSLFFQLIHWYTHATQIRTKHSAIIIEAITEGITHPSDTALRDFSGQCINEFVTWTIKQSNESNLIHDPANIKVLVKKMRFYSAHPDSCKKRGAALIFNSIYKVLREEDALLNIFWIEFLHIFVKSLSLVETRDDSSLVQINSALNHLERGFVDMSELFNKPDTSRRIPIDIKGDVLKDVSSWLLLQTGSKSPYCREKCMELFCKLTPYTKNYQSLQTFISENVSKTQPDWVAEIYESFLKKYPTLESATNGCDNDINPIRWVHGVIWALSGYNFIIRNDLVPSNTFLNNTILDAIRYFINKVSLTTLNDALALIKTKEWIFMDFEKQEFNKEKATCAEKVYEFFNVILSNYKYSSYMSSFYGPELKSFVVNSLFNKEAQGFDVFIESSGELSNQMKDFIKKLPDCELANILGDDIFQNAKIFTDVNIRSNIAQKHINMLKGLTMLQSFNLNQCQIQKFTKGLVSELLYKFIPSANRGIYKNEIQYTTLNYCLSILNFALDDEDEFTVFLNFLYKSYRVQTMESDRQIHFGIYIMSLFEDSVLKKMIDKFHVVLDFILKQTISLELTMDLILYVLNYLRIKCHPEKNKEVVEKILIHWHKFKKYFKVDISNVYKGIRMVKKMFPVMKTFKIQDENLNKWLIELLTYSKCLSRENELEMKTEILALIMSTAETLDDASINLINKKLGYLKKKCFIDSSRLPLEIRLTSLDKLFNLVPTIKTPALLLFVLDIYIHISTEESSVDVKSVLEKYIKKNTDAIQARTLTEIYEMCYNQSLDSFFKKYKLMSNIVSLFQYCSLSVFEEFLIKNLNKITTVLQHKTEDNTLPEKILHFILLEVLCLRCPINSQEAFRITQAALPNEASKELFLQWFKHMLDVFRDSNSVTHNEQLRLCRCHAYNAMVSMIGNSIKDEYIELFIQKDKNNVDILWSNLVDVNKKYSFESDFETIPKRKKILVTIRGELRDCKRTENKDFESVKYLESLRIFNSSLSEDISKFDFTNYIIRSQSEANQENKTTVLIQNEVDLECIDVNTHECMANVCGLIYHMVATKITILPSNENEDYTLPEWVEAIRTLLLSPNTHNNVKIFWVKVIYNTSDVFKHFAKWFLKPLVKFLVDRCPGTSINYFTIDVVAILADWSNKVVPSEQEEVELVSELLAFLIGDVSNERRDMFKYHLELIKLLVEAWKTSIKIPRELIFSKLNVNPASEKVEIGIHLISILLVNNILPWGENRKCHDYLTVLQNIIKENKKSNVYKACSETIGLILKCSKDQQHFLKLVNNVSEMLKTIDAPDKYLRSLEAMVLQYPQIADEFHLNKILSKIHAVPKNLKLISLKIICSRHDVIGEVNDFKTEKWDDYIKNDDLEVQLLTLEVVYKCLDVLRNSDNFNSIIESVCKHTSNFDVLCRTHMYNIAIKICQDKKLYSQETIGFCEEVLIQGIADNDEEIRETVFKFWENDISLPSQISERFVYILSNLYRKNTENDFLGYSVYLLLDVMKKRDGYKEVLFEYPLDDCDFEDYKLETNWRCRHLSVVPLFAESLQSLNENPRLMDESEFNKLRQTQTSMVFKPTQSVRTMELRQLTMSQSSLYVNSENHFSSIDHSRITTTSEENTVLKKRFQRDLSKISKHFAHQAIKKSVEREEKRKDLVKERENKITLYRKYRKGDLPDIQIKLQDLLQPLQVLTLCDDELAHILYLEIYNSILNKMDQDYLNKILTKIQEIFSNSTQFNRNVFRTLLNTLLLSKRCKNMCQLINPDLVSTVSRSTGLATLGALLLEEYLTNSYDDPTATKRSRNEFLESGENCWIKLAELYKEMNEWDMVKSVLLEKMDCGESMHNAAMAESRKQWQEAKELYEELIKTDESYERKENYYESYYKCFAYLGEWEPLVDSIHKFTSEDDHWSKLWDEGFNQQKLLPWYISGQLKKTLFSGTISNQFLKDLNNTLSSVNLDYLQSNFTEELAMIWIFKEETDEAEQYVKNYINNFLDSWQLLDPLYNNIRYEKILKLRNVIDIGEFIQVFHDLTTDCNIKLYNLFSYWNRTIKEHLPSILLCEERVLYRKQFISLLEKKNNLEKQEGLKSFIEELEHMKHHLDENLISTAIEEENLTMANKYLQIYDCNITKLDIPFSKYQIIRCKTKGSVEKLGLLLNASDNLSSLAETEDSDSKVSACLQRFFILGEISACCGDNNELLEIAKTRFSSVSSARDISLLGAGELKSVLLLYENDKNTRMESETNRSNLNEHEIVANAYVQLAYFAKKQGNGYFTEFMVSVLKAMKFDSSEGRQLFPCILMEQDFSEDDKKLFAEESEKIPAWMFLPWIPQLLVNIDSCKVSVVAPLILKIAETYPQSIMYAYRLSKENYSFQNNPFTEQLIAKLDNLLLNDTRIDKVLKALSFVGVPEAILEYYITSLIKACRPNNEEEFLVIQNQIITHVFNDEPNSRNINAMQGDMFKKIKEFKEKISDITRSNSIKTDLENVNKQLTKILEDDKEMKKNSQLLQDYSPWLASFSATAINLDLEIPGQYDGKRIPLTQHHIRIAGFCPNVSCVITSLRKPFQVTVLGNDTKQYPFLIKFGEDVRQDQRIQQLFSLMNNIFVSDRNISKEYFSILTYQVVPLASNLGIIQWLDNTICLQEFVKKPLKSSNCFKEARKSYNKWIYKESTNYTYRDAYGVAAVNNSRDDTIKNFLNLEFSIPMDILRSAFFKISANTESFVALRNNFIRSYSVMCVSHWILGVGDRHLSNILISTKTGKVLGVDFGHAFGTATQILSVPELVPFRLTPHIVSLMEPLKEKGLFRETMIRSLRALRQNTGSLLATMKVFILEPTLDWRKYAYRFSEIANLNCDWELSQKVNQAHRKLDGANPTTIMCEDLIAGHKNRYLGAYLSLVKGDRYCNFRAKNEEDNLSVENQVDCLIDHATDLNLLGRMYEGWEPWV